MPIENEMLDIEDDNPAEADEPVTPKNTGKPRTPAKQDDEDADFGPDAREEIDIAAAMRGETPAKATPKVATKPPAAEAPADDAPEETPADEPAPEPTKAPETPAVDFEAEAERRAEERYQARLVELQKQHEADRQRAIDSIVAKERKREGTAQQKLRDIQAMTGLDADKLLEAHRTREIERMQDEDNLTESAARALYEARSRAALLEDREAERQREHTESVKANEYRGQKLAFLDDPKQEEIYKVALRKFGTDVDEFSDHGKTVAFDVALRYIAGQHLPEIVADIRSEGAGRETKLKTEIETARRAGEQAALRNNATRAKAAPETSTSGTPQRSTLPPGLAEMAAEMGIKARDVAKTMAAKAKRR